MTLLQTNWSILEQPPLHCSFTQLLPLNNHEFLVVPVTTKKYIHRFPSLEVDSVRKEYENADGIYKYNSISKQWTKIMDYPKDFQSHNHIATIDNKNNIIYILNDNSIFIKIDLNTKTIEKINCNFFCGTLPGLIYANGDIHVIGGKGIPNALPNTYNRKHLIFNEEEKAFKEVNEFNTNIFPIPIYLKRSNSIMAIIGDGPYPLIEYRNNVWKSIEIIKNKHPDIVMVTTTQDFMIFMQFRDCYMHMRQKIFVYNLKNKIMHESKIKSAMFYDAKGIITRNNEGDEILTFGFINRCYKGNDFKEIQKLPFYLIKFVSKWVCFETAHFIEFKGNGKHTHWEIDVDKIINL